MQEPLRSQYYQVWINDKFEPLLEDYSRVLILFGGAGSGKSFFASQKVLQRITTEKNHRILCMRKYAVSLRESVFKQLKLAIDELDISSEFIINKSEMKFYHIPTGNEIICNGMDDPEKLKSIVGITSIWMEEPTEFTEEEYEQADLRLRGLSDNYKQIIMTFNPVDERHWIKKRFFDTEQEGVKIVHSTVDDNFCIDQEYKKVLDDKAIQNPNFYRIYRLGEWGKPDVQRPYIHNFIYDKHVSSSAIYRNTLPVIVSMDFNLDPLVCVMAHKWRDSTGDHLHFFHEIVLNNGDLQTMAERIKDTLTPVSLANALFTGDATGQSRSIQQRDKASDWQLLQRMLNIAPARIKLPGANPSVAGSRNFINTIFFQHNDLKFNPNMKVTINEIMFTEADEEGKIMKTDRTKLTQRFDCGDCVRYTLNNFVTIR